MSTFCGQDQPLDSDKESQVKNKLIHILVATVAILWHFPAEAKMTESEFQEHVLSFLTDTYVSYEFKKSPEPLIIKMDSVELGLQNIYATYSAKEFEQSELPGLLEDHFSRVIGSIKTSSERATPPWAQARGMVRPQLAPRNYTEKIPLVHEALDEYIVSAYVIDSDAGYQYVLEDDLKKWKIGVPELRAAANENLEAASREMAMQASNGQEKFIAVQVLDGYDAARILMPGLRKFLAEQLGSPFYAALSNRDFLVVWSGQNSQAFKEFAANKARKDFQTQPYSLSPNVFRVTPNVVERME